MNEVEFLGKITVQIESRAIRKKLPLLSTGKEATKPLQGKDWLRDFNWTIRKMESATTINDQSEMDKKFANFENIHRSEQKIEDTEIKIQQKQ